jgi:hypothetical protein
LLLSATVLSLVGRRLCPLHLIGSLINLALFGRPGCSVPSFISTGAAVGGGRHW